MGIFIRNGRLRSGWRVTLYVLAYLLGLFLLQIPILSLYAIFYVASRGLTTPEDLFSALLPRNLPLSQSPTPPVQRLIHTSPRCAQHRVSIQTPPAVDNPSLSSTFLPLKGRSNLSATTYLIFLTRSR